MAELTVAQICHATGGEAMLVEPTQTVRGWCTDSEDVVNGSMFIGIRGQKVDGHVFAAQAIARGAVVVLSDRALDVPCIVVDDTVAALGNLARWWRRQLGQLTVVAITGSSGKTSTKDLTAQVLASAGPTVAPLGSLNTEIGVPLTILRADPSTRFLVLEMGMRGPGQIAELVDIAAPDIAVIVNVGTAHLELLGSRAALLLAKGEIVAGLTAQAIAILPGDDQFVADLPTPARRVLFGESARCQVRAVDVHLDQLARASFTLQIGEAASEEQLHLHGEHFIGNALAAAAVGSAVGMDVVTIARALSAATLNSKWRMQVIATADEVTVINDAYNANPESVRAALKALVAMRGAGRTWAVLGEMRELGDSSVEEHDAVGRLAVRLDVSRLICVGPATRVMHLGASNEGSWGDESIWVPEVQDAIDLLLDQVQPGDVVLVKASRSIGLEAVADALIHANGGAA